MASELDLIRDNLRSVIRGKDEGIDLLLAALLAGGHVLIEDLPGLGKTTLAKALARSIRASFHRVQFTPDLLPTDVLGGSVYNATSGSFTFSPGPIFTNVLLADEINRASPRTQSALLEAMAEGQATIEGQEHALPDLFMVIATQNPIEFHGTYPLPEAQLDRFVIRMTLGYTDADTERQVLFEQAQAHPLASLKPVSDGETVLAAQAAARSIFVHKDVGQYIVDRVRATRNHEQVRVGASPRGSLALFNMAKAIALLAGRDHVRPEDVQSVATAVLAHRILLQTKARHAGVDPATIVQQAVSETAVPR